MPYVSGFLIEGPVDPEFGRPGGPVDPGYGRPGGGGPTDPGFGRPPPIGGTLPEQPPGIWPPINWHTPIQPLPPESNVPPGTIWPPPGHVGGGPMPGRPGHPDAGLPAAPARPDAGLPTPPSGTLPVKRLFWMLAYCPALGWNFVCVDPSLSVGTPLPPTPEPK